MSEIPRLNRGSSGIPRCAKGYGPGEFLYFQWIASIDPLKFKVIVEDLAGRWINLGPIRTQVLIPNTYWDPHATLIVVGTNKSGQQVRYIGEMTRGNMYVLHTDQPGDSTMQKYLPKYNL